MRLSSGVAIILQNIRKIKKNKNQKNFKANRMLDNGILALYG